MILTAALVALACGGAGGVGERLRGAPEAPPAAAPDGAAAPGGAPSEEAPAPREWREGEDYFVVERARFLDQMGFDQPVEAFSVLLPRDWSREGGVTWLTPQQCRGDLVTTAFTARSPDGAWSMTALPSKTWVAADDPAMTQLLQSGASQGGCALRSPTDARALLESDIGGDAGGATARNVRDNNELIRFLAQLDDQANATSQQYGTGLTQRSSAVEADLSWPDGSRGHARYAVITSELAKRDYLSGGVTRMYTTMAIERTWLRYPAAKKADAERLFTTILASHRTNPVWADAKTKYLTWLGNAEHARNMERIRLVGEQAAAYARERSAEQDRQLRSWEAGQDSQDRQHTQFLQTIREVETWKGESGAVELSAGYDHAWSGGDGTYLLSSAPGFDPDAAFLESRWSELKRAE